MIDRKLNYNDREDQRRIGAPFLMAMRYRPKIDLYESDLGYIDNNIKSHPLFRYINGKVFGRKKDKMKISDEESINTDFVQIVFYEQFLDAPNCPPRVCYIIKNLLGKWYEQLNRCHIDITDEQGNYVVDEKGNRKQITADEIFALRRPMVERWLERGKAWS